MHKKSKVVFSILILTLLIWLPAKQPAFGQDGPGQPEAPTAPEITSTVYLPIVALVNAPPPPQTSSYIIDHNSVGLFSRIPERYLTAARNLRLLYSDRSVGQNIDEGLNCLTSTSWGEADASCRRDYYDALWNWRTYTATDLANGLVPTRIQFTPSPLLYNRSNWTYVFRGDSWSELTRDFIQSLAPSYINTKDVLTYQFSYLNVAAESDIADPNTGYFANNPDKYDIYDLEAFMQRYPNKIFFFWTTSLARGIGTQPATQFNARMRQYAIEHRSFLLDVAAIESYTDRGVPCYDNRDGIPYLTENYPNDHVNLPAICQDYTTETDGGHLGSVSAGKIRIAKAFWVLMARIAGWDGVSQ